MGLYFGAVYLGEEVALAETVPFVPSCDSGVKDDCRATGQQIFGVGGDGQPPSAL